MADVTPATDAEIERYRTDDPECFRDRLIARIDAEKAELEKAKGLLGDALRMIGEAAPSAWANGNTHPDNPGGIDEGEVMAGRWHDGLIAGAKELGLGPDVLGCGPGKPMTVFAGPTMTIASTADGMPF